VAYVGIVGRKSEHDTIERVLSATPSTQVAVQFNGNGLRAKRTFRTLELCTVVFGMSCKIFGREILVNLTYIKLPIAFVSSCEP